MLLLALDTSGAAVTAALHDGQGVLAERTVLDARRHAELLAPTVAGVLADVRCDRTDLTVIAVGVGPGPFTGLRVGVATGRVLGAALGVPVHGVCSLDALAEASTLTGEYLVASDARRREVYWAAYRREAPGTAPVRLDGPHVGRPADLPRAGRPVVGRGASLYPDELGGLDVRAGAEPLDVRAGALAAVVVRGLSADTAERVLLPVEPLYLRRPDAVEPGARKRVLR
jgi:tRNA threonylcarbamoyladenosine biosynthesis protein TsaB